MARLILQQENLNLDNTGKTIEKNGFISDRDILKYKKYIELIGSLDSKTLTETKGMEELMKSIQEEFGTAEISSLPLGIVSKCFLGHPYDVHTLDLVGKQIIKHYQFSESLEADFEKARAVARHNSYALVEVYRDKIILIREDGSATKL